MDVYSVKIGPPVLHSSRRSVPIEWAPFTTENFTFSYYVDYAYCNARKYLCSYSSFVMFYDDDDDDHHDCHLFSLISGHVTHVAENCETGESPLRKKRTLIICS